MMRELDRDPLEASRDEPRFVLALGERTCDAAVAGTTLAALLGSAVVFATMSPIPTRPPGSSTRAISVSTPGCRRMG
jgi:hypothetical protein